MKNAVYTLVILFLIGGLTLLYVDSKTESPFQTLSEVEMLETQGTDSTDDFVEERSKVRRW